MAILGREEDGQPALGRAGGPDEGAGLLDEGAGLLDEGAGLLDEGAGLLDEGAGLLDEVADWGWQSLRLFRTRRPRCRW